MIPRTAFIYARRLQWAFAAITVAGLIIYNVTNVPAIGTILMVFGVLGFGIGLLAVSVYDDQEDER